MQKSGPHPVTTEGHPEASEAAGKTGRGTKQNPPLPPGPRESQLELRTTNPTHTHLQSKQTTNKHKLQHTRIRAGPGVVHAARPTAKESRAAAPTAQQRH